MDSSDGLNVGDVTGPRWAGGTRNPDAIDSSNAERAVSLEELRMSPAERIMFTAGRASRDDEVEALQKDLDGYGTQGALAYERAERMLNRKLKIEALRERNVLREQLAAAEARAVHAELEWAEADARIVLAEAAKADAWDEGARYVTHDSTYTEMFDIPKNPYRRTGDTNA